MQELEKHIRTMLEAGVTKIIISHPAAKSEVYKKITVEKKGKGYQIAKYTETQVFHENIAETDTAERLTELISGTYRQVNGMAPEAEHILLISKKGVCSYKVKRSAEEHISRPGEGHNRKKNYILQEGEIIPPLIDMGIFTKEGRVVRSMYDKYRQINRFIEILDDEISKKDLKSLNVIDFGCGKSYLTFIVYYYLTEIRKVDTRIIGLDLKEDVIRKCNLAANKYGYTGLRFELGDINGYDAPFDVDMVITLHACDTATDYALFNAIRWKAGMIFSVPCCQHELNQQMKPENLKLFSRYGIIQERFAALATDAIRANLLETRGYRTQLLEFIDLQHTPKNIMIRAVRRGITPEGLRKQVMEEVERTMEEFGFRPTLYRLLEEK
ncbi:MAG: SAM-dependent methyltransferase [Eubacterium sp.]|nr:SAM-dependent methyltransferase [Eubacterium sp.]